MKLLKIAFVAVFVLIIEGNTEEHMAERVMSRNLEILDDSAELVDLSELETPEISDTSIPKSAASMHPSTTAFPNSEKIESLAEEIILSTLCGAISKLKHNNLENSTSEASESFTSSFSSSTLEDEVNKLQDISTTSNTIFRNENDMIDDPLSSEVDESLELPMSKKSEENESQISVIDSSYLNEEESIAFCQKTLICEEKLKWRELICHRQLAYSNFILEGKTKLSDMSVQAEIITNSGVADVVESVSKACMKPITSDVLRQLSKLLRKMELGRKLCMRRAVINQNLLPVRNKAICEKIAFDETHNETTDIDKRKFNNLETRQNAFDYCAAITAPIKKHCEALKQCCPNYIRCTELMAQMNVSKKYEELLNRIKQIQSNCEKKMMETLQSFDSVFKLPV